MRFKENFFSQLLTGVLLILLLPLLIPCAIIAIIAYLFEIPKKKRVYKDSPYYADLNIKFTVDSIDSPEFRFYNSAVRRKLPMQYIKQESNGFEYFIYDKTIYLFPDFDQLTLNEENTVWEADYDGTWKPFDECYGNLLAKLENTCGYPVKLLMERNMIPDPNLQETGFPECVFITWNYESAFENEDSPLKAILPQSSKELYDMMLQTPDLCGKFELSDDKKEIRWNIHENITIVIDAEPQDCYLCVFKSLSGKAEKEIIHWHPSISEIYDDVLKIGKRGNVLVIRSRVFGDAVLYYGSKNNCPYSRDKKYLFGKYYYLEAK